MSIRRDGGMLRTIFFIAAAALAGDQAIHAQQGGNPAAADPPPKAMAAFDAATHSPRGSASLGMPAENMPAKLATITMLANAAIPSRVARDTDKRRRVAEQIRGSRAEEETELWLRRLRDEAYVEYKL